MLHFLVKTTMSRANRHINMFQTHIPNRIKQLDLSNKTKSMIFILEQTPKNMKIISQQYSVMFSLGSKICHRVSPDSFVVIHHKHPWLRPYRLHGSHGLWCMDTAHHVLGERSHRDTGEFLVGCCFVTTKIWGSSTKGQLEMWNFGKRDMLIFKI